MHTISADTWLWIGTFGERRISITSCNVEVQEPYKPQPEQEGS